jgi:hypothetical protein
MPEAKDHIDLKEPSESDDLKNIFVSRKDSAYLEELK